MKGLIDPRQDRLAMYRRMEANIQRRIEETPDRYRACPEHMAPTINRIISDDHARLREVQKNIADYALGVASEQELAA